MRRYLTISPYLLIAGAIAWSAKLAVIVATGGRVVDSGAAAVLYLIGLPLLLAGIPGVALRVTAGKPTVVRVLAAVGIFIAFPVVTMALGDGLARIVGDAAPLWVREEIGILLAVLVGGAAGVALLSRRAPEPATA